MYKRILITIITICLLLSAVGCSVGDTHSEDAYIDTIISENITTDIFNADNATIGIIISDNITTAYLDAEEIEAVDIVSDNGTFTNLTTDNLTIEYNTYIEGPIALVDDGKVWLEFRTDIDFESVRAHGVPTYVTRGPFGAFSLPVFAADNEELRVSMCVPGRWSEPAWQKVGDTGDEPGGMASYNGNLYIPCEADNNVWVYDGTTLSISGDVGDAPVYSCVYDGILYVSCSGDDTVWAFNGTSWYKSGDVGNSPEGMVSSGGDLYVACRLDDSIWRLSGGVWAVDPALGAGGIAGAVGDAPQYMVEYGGDIYVSCASLDDDVWIRTGGAWAKDDDVGNGPAGFHEHDGDLYLTCENDDTVWKRSAGAWAVCTNIQTVTDNAPIGVEEYEDDLFIACMNSVWSNMDDFWNQNSDYSEVTADQPMFLKVHDGRLYCSAKVGDSLWVYEGETTYVHVHCWITSAQAAATDAFRLFLEYENYTAGVDIVQSTGDDVIIEVLTGVAAQYQSYLLEFPLDMTGVETDDSIDFILQSITSSDDIAGEIAIEHVAVIFKCDKLGNEEP